MVLLVVLELAVLVVLAELQEVLVLLEHQVLVHRVHLVLLVAQEQVV